LFRTSKYVGHLLPSCLLKRHNPPFVRQEMVRMGRGYFDHRGNDRAMEMGLKTHPSDDPVRPYTRGMIQARHGFCLAARRPGQARESDRIRCPNCIRPTRRVHSLITCPSRAMANARHRNQACNFIGGGACHSDMLGSLVSPVSNTLHGVAHGAADLVSSRLRLYCFFTSQASQASLRS
jgi:hypothetical protein